MKISKRNTLIGLVFVILLLQQAILQYTNGFLNRLISYFDEAITVFIILITLLKIIKKKYHLDHYDKMMLQFFGGFIIICFLSNALYPIQSIGDNIADFIVCTRFIAFYYAGKYLLPKRVDEKKLINGLSKICEYITFFTFTVGIHDFFLAPFFIKPEIRYGIGALQLFYPHPSYMAVGCFTCLCVFGIQLSFRQSKKRKYTILILMNCILMCTSLRSKAIASAAATIILFYIIVIRNFQFKKILYTLGGLLVIVLGSDQLKFYYGKQVVGGTRAMLTRDSISLASRYFPFGTGFGTFASNTAAKHYSPLYIELGYLSIEGGRENAFLSDTFWPIVIAQSGWIGTICFIGTVICLFLTSNTLEKNNLYLYWVTLSILSYELISSIAEPAFFNPSVAVLFWLFGFCSHLGKVKKE